MVDFGKQIYTTIFDILKIPVSLIDGVTTMPMRLGIAGAVFLLVFLAIHFKWIQVKAERMVEKLLISGAITLVWVIPQVLYIPFAIISFLIAAIAAIIYWVLSVLGIVS